jgi:hypothetical protein
MARPSLFTERLFATIIERIANGESLRAVCRDDAMPSPPTVLRWVANDLDLQQRYAFALDARADMIFDEVLEIADDTSKDWVVRDGGPVLDAEHVRRSALRVDARKWALARMAPKKYGDKVQLGATGNGSGAISISWLATEDGFNGAD